MAFSAMKFSLFLLLTLLSSLHTHARVSQFFNKVPSTMSDVPLSHNKQSVVDNEEQEQEQDPTFLPEIENTYGLYDHESGLNPPSSTTTTAPITVTATTPEFKQPSHKYLPKNYNPVSYVTQPEDINETTTFSEKSTNPNNNDYNSEKNYYNNNQQETEETEFRNYPSAATTKTNNLNGGASKYSGGATARNVYQQQGMSDTRFLENGKYFYDINADKYNNNHPYESLKDARSDVRTSNEYNYNKNFYGNGENNGYQNQYQIENQDEFVDEESLP